ncbi:MAG: GHKL domain-containing protein [Oscillospiraceae bacterium]|nr:GHKL domain-containing protein [Oscillospiraceae bacterium]
MSLTDELIEVFACVAECLIYIRFITGFLGFKSENNKLLKCAGLMLPVTLSDVLFSGHENLDLLSIALTLLFLFVFSCIFLEGNTFKKLFAILPVYTFQLPINTITISIASLLTESGRAAALPGGELRLPLILITKLVFFAVCEVMIKLHGRNKFSLNKYQRVTLLSCFTISSTIGTLLWEKFRLHTDGLAVLSIVYMLIAALNVLLYAITNKMQLDNIEREEYKLLKANVSAQEKLVAEVRERYSEVRTLRHDMRHYLTAAAELISDDRADEAKEYIERIIDEKINAAGAGVNTGSAVVDAVINNKLALCAKSGIRAKCAIDTRFGGSADVDISILLSNLLDNAVNGCDPADPRIELVIGSRKSLIYIAVKNTIAGSVLSGNPTLDTDKEDKSVHGFGIKSVRNIAEKYGGSVDFTEEKNCFTAEVWLKPEK